MEALISPGGLNPSQVKEDTLIRFSASLLAKKLKQSW
jgi:hypothetical protein